MCLAAGLKRNQELTVELMVKNNFEFGKNAAGRKEGSPHFSPNHILKSLMYLWWNDIVNQTI